MGFRLVLLVPHGDLGQQIWMHNMISELRPASRAQVVSFGNVATQDVIGRLHGDLKPVGCLLPTWGAFCIRGRPRAVGCLLPARGALGPS